MIRIPLVKKIKNKKHLNIAFIQDLLVVESYNHFPFSVIHGGTAVWRCYNGNRFSEDIDFYLSSFGKKKIDKFVDSLGKRGFLVKKFKTTDNAVYSNLSYQGETVRFEAVKKDFKDYVTRRFEMTDGTSIIVNTLSPEQIVKEKLSAYLNRRKIRDLYDIFFLLDQVEREKVKKDLGLLLRKFESPLDKEDLKSLIILGSVPKVEDMINEIKRWAR